MKRAGLLFSLLFTFHLSAYAGSANPLPKAYSVNGISVGQMETLHDGAGIPFPGRIDTLFFNGKPIGEMVCKSNRTAFSVRETLEIKIASQEWVNEGAAPDLCAQYEGIFEKNQQKRKNSVVTIDTGDDGNRNTEFGTLDVRPAD